MGGKAIIQHAKFVPPTPCQPWSICTQCCSKNTSCNVNIFMCSLDFLCYFDIFSSNKVNVTVYNMPDISKFIGKVMILLCTTSPVLVCWAIMTLICPLFWFFCSHQSGLHLFKHDGEDEFYYSRSLAIISWVTLFIGRKKKGGSGRWVQRVGADVPQGRSVADV